MAEATWRETETVTALYMAGPPLESPRRHRSNKSPRIRPGDHRRPVALVIPKTIFSSFSSAMAAAAAATRRAIACELAPQRAATARTDPRAPATVAVVPRIQAADPSPEGARILLQPRVANLRSYGSGPGRGAAVVVSPPRRNGGSGGGSDPSPFFVSLADYIESSRRSQDFETLSGRLAMLAFAGAVTAEVVTGSSVFRKLELGEMAGAAGACLGVVAGAAAMAWASSMRTRIGRMFTLGCGTVVDALIDSLVDGLFFDSDPTDWTDDL